jgi:hypothetical protein
MRPTPSIAAAFSLSLIAFAATAQTVGQPAPSSFNGVWERVGAITFDPTLRDGAVDQPPYNVQYAARYKMMLDAAKAGHPFADPTAACLFAGMPRFMNLAMPMEIAVVPGKVFIMAEWNSEVRRIYTDGRPHPADPDPTYNGHSVGHWDKDQLLVDTVALRSETNFAASGAPHSDAMHISERFWLAAPDTLKDEITVEDPKAFVKPWVVVKTYHRQPTWEIQEYVCADNNRNPVEGNVTGALLTSPKK